MEKQGLFSKENVGNGVFIFTQDGNFISPKFWGLYEQTESPVGIAILEDRKLLIALEGSKNSLVLLDYGKELPGTKFDSWNEARKDVEGIQKTKDLASIGSPAAQFCLNYERGMIGKEQWYIPTADDFQLMFDHKKELDIALAISGGNAIETDDWHWISTRRYDKSNWIFNWSDGSRNYDSQINYYRVRPVSAFLSTL